jgi:hypothetical protein
VPLSVDVDGYKGDLVFDVCPDLDVLYAYPRGDVSRELARRNGTLDKSVDGRHQDVWDADFYEPKPGCGVRSGGYNAAALAPPVARGVPPPSRTQYDEGDRGGSLWEHARTTWYEGATGLPLTGSAAARTRQYDKATRAYRYDARGIPSRPSPKKACSGARSAAPVRASAKTAARRGAVATAPAAVDVAKTASRTGAVAISRTPVDAGGVGGGAHAGSGGADALKMLEEREEAVGADIAANLRTPVDAGGARATPQCVCPPPTPSTARATGPWATLFGYGNTRICWPLADF